VFQALETARAQLSQGFTAALDDSRPWAKPRRAWYGEIIAL
jgi:hypothetical protein